MTETDNTFEFLIDYITAKVVERIIAVTGCGLEEALLAFHNSETFDRLSEKSTGMYIESPAFIYDIYQQELRRGTIRGLSE